MKAEWNLQDRERMEGYVSIFIENQKLLCGLVKLRKYTNGSNNTVTNVEVR
jgi:hypothetical protein